jgi:uncharacterized transporter YbjL
MDWLILAVLVIFVITHIVEKRKNDALVGALSDALTATRGLAAALDRASKEHPVLIASSKNAKDIVEQIEKIYRKDKQDERKSRKSEAEDHK